MKLSKMSLTVVKIFAALALALPLSGAAWPGNPTNSCLAEDGPFITSDGGCKERNTGLVWSGALYGLATYKYANTYCQDLVEGDKNDWRLPTLAELRGISAKTYPAGTSPVTYLNITTTGLYWSSTSGKTGRYAVVPETGFYNSYSQTSGLSGVCVRQGTP